MAKVPQPAETIQDWPFPLSGIDLAHEFDRQPISTTPVGVNVRSFPPLGERGRGGSRGGLSKYIDDLVEGVNVIQHLNLIVDPTTEALNTDDDVMTPTRPFFDAKSGNFIRTGGSGRVPLRRIVVSPPPPPPPPSGVELRQVFVGIANLSQGHVSTVGTGQEDYIGTLFDQPTSYHFSADVLAGSLILIALSWGNGATLTSTDGTFQNLVSVGSVTDNQGNAYTLCAESHGVESLPHVSLLMYTALYRAVASASGQLTFTVTFHNDRVAVAPPGEISTVFGSGPRYGLGGIIALEYPGLEVGDPLDATSVNSGRFTNAQVTQEYSTGPIAMTTDNDLIVGVLRLQGGYLGETIEPEQVLLSDPLFAVATPGQFGMLIVHCLDYTGAIVSNPNIKITKAGLIGGALPYLDWSAVGASFRSA